MTPILLTTPTITFTQNNTGGLCIDSAPITAIADVFGGNFFLNGTLFDGEINPGILGPGEFLLTYIVKDSNNCSYSTSRTITVASPSTVSISGLPTR